ncbi:MAG: GNAT family N-acetyltransferase [Alistipes sp.]|nr:GNAT family N-acetyltransferase [Alistipes sp.]
MKPIIAPVERQLLLDELTTLKKVRDTRRGGNEIYIFTAESCPNLMREIGRLREESFRAAGGGSGNEIDIDEGDNSPAGYTQLIAWDPAAHEIIGAYRYIICTRPHLLNLSTEHYFRFSPKFRKLFLPRTIELGRAFVQPRYQNHDNPKSIFALDNLWDGLGAIIAMNPRARYLFGKVTLYSSYNIEARNALFYFLHKYFPDKDRLIKGRNPLKTDFDTERYQQLFNGGSYEDDYRILTGHIRNHKEAIPPLINAYMNLSRTMRVFDTVSNADLGGILDTGILINIKDILPEKLERYTRW